MGPELCDDGSVLKHRRGTGDKLRRRRRRWQRRQCEVQRVDGDGAGRDGEGIQLGDGLGESRRGAAVAAGWQDVHDVEEAAGLRCVREQRLHHAAVPIRDDRRLLAHEAQCQVRDLYPRLVRPLDE